MSRPQILRKVPFFSLADLHTENRPALDAAFARVIESSSFIMGPELEQFEAAFAHFCGVRHAIGVGTGLDALTLTLRGLGIGPGDEVIVPAHTFVASWLAVDQAGATVVPVEVDPRTFNLDPVRAAAAITPRTRAIIAVHLYGRLAPMAELRKVAEAAGIPVIEDAAQAHGAAAGNRRAGSLGRAAAFSFYPTKNLGALGDGGAVTTDDDALAERIRMLRNYGSKVKYEHELLGTNSRLDELQAALLSAKLPGLDGKNAKRRALARRYTASLRGCPGVVAPPEDSEGEESVWHLYVIRSARRDALREALAREGIATLVHYPISCRRQEAYAGRHFAADLGQSDRLAAEVLSLPLWPEMADSDVDHVAAAVQACARALENP